jgi:hypothetical protein
MPRWFKVDINVMSHYKMRALAETTGFAGPVFHVAALAWVKQHGTEGAIPRRALPLIELPALVTDEERYRLAIACEGVRLWDKGNLDGWVIHNWASYQSPGRGYDDRSPGDNVRSISTGLGRGSVPEVVGDEMRRRSLDISLSSLEDSNNRMRAQDYAPTDGQSQALATACPECGMRQRRHLLECSLGKGIPLGPVAQRQGLNGCPSCGMPWSLPHSAECNYDPRHPLDASPVIDNTDGDIPAGRMPVEELRKRLRGKA